MPPFIPEKVERGWQPIETAPRDGRAILLLALPYTSPANEWCEAIHHPARVNIGQWNADGDSWVPEDHTQETYVLKVTGVWDSGGGWFQPDEISHWMPLPAPPAIAQAEASND